MSLSEMISDAFARADGYLNRAMNAPAARSASAPALITAGGSGLHLQGLADRSRSQSRRQSEHMRGWVYSSIRTIANRAASRPLKMARLSGVAAPSEDQSRSPASRPRVRPHRDLLPVGLKAIAPQLESVDSHEFLDLMAFPNPFTPRWALMGATVASLYLTGAAYWLDTEQDGDPGLWHLPTPWVTPRHKESPFSGWDVRPYESSEHYEYAADRVVRFAFPDPDDPLGCLSPTQMQSAAISADESIQSSQDRAFKNGIFPGVILTVGRPQEVPGVDSRPRLTDSQRRDIIHAVRSLYRGVLRYDEPLILDALIHSVHKLSNVPREMDFLNSGRQTKSRIVQGYGLNPFVMGEIENANRAVAVVAEDNFVTNVINPLLDMMGQVLTMHLYRRTNDRSLVLYFEPDRANDPEMTLRERDQLIKSGSLTRNELRAFHRLPPLPGKAGETIVLMPGQALVPSDADFHDGASVGVGSGQGAGGGVVRPLAGDQAGDPAGGGPDDGRALTPDEDVFDGRPRPPAARHDREV